MTNDYVRLKNIGPKNARVGMVDTHLAWGLPLDGRIVHQAVGEPIRYSD